VRHSQHPLSDAPRKVSTILIVHRMNSPLLAPPRNQCRLLAPQKTTYPVSDTRAAPWRSALQEIKITPDSVLITIPVFSKPRDGLLNSVLEADGGQPTRLVAQAAHIGFKVHDLIGAERNLTEPKW
jgi:hypothetical protein